MKAIFIDADVLIALNDRSDLLHAQAVELLTRLIAIAPVFYTGTNILLEALTVIRQRVGKKEALQLLEELRSDRYVVIHPNDWLVQQAEVIFAEIASKNISYSDCMSFALMKNTHLEWVFSFDEDFKKQGLKRFGFKTG